tara:strand:+ start:60 stop:212 length:153 start_codon:yes stop_codon:yes gene_type:complete
MANIMVNNSNDSSPDFHQKKVMMMLKTITCTAIHGPFFLEIGAGEEKFEA